MSDDICPECGGLHEHQERHGEFAVCQFFEDGSYEYVRQWVDAKTAVETAARCTSTVAARVGIVRRVIVTDGDDCTNFEWKYGKGVTFK